MNQRCHQAFIEQKGLPETLHGSFQREYFRSFQELVEYKKEQLFSQLAASNTPQFIIQYLRNFDFYLGEPWSKEFAPMVAGLFKLDYLSDNISASEVMQRFQKMGFVKQITRAGYQPEGASVPSPTNSGCRIIENAGTVNSMLWRWSQSTSDDVWFGGVCLKNNNMVRIYCFMLSFLGSFLLAAGNSSAQQSDLSLQIALQTFDPTTGDIMSGEISPTPAQFRCFFPM
jgi:hypothetical protein